MWTEDSIFQESLDDAVAVDFIPWNDLKEKVIFITGGTGLIGSTLIRVIIRANHRYELNLKVIALVRNIEKAKEKFKSEDYSEKLIFCVGSVENLPEINEDVDYIIHGASQTSSKEFINHAVETIQTAVVGTQNLLELAVRKQVKAFVYLSSMEIYGYPERGHKVTEKEAGALSPLDIRNSYPISKQMCEAMCCAYASEYSIPVKIARLTQTFGPGVNYDDTRIFAYFARCVVEKKDIVLKTKGETERCYLYTSDAVTAILTIMLKGKSGQAYNCADENTYCSIAEMAEKVATDGGISVKYEIENEAKNGFPKTLYMYLDTTQLCNIGWKPIGGGIEIGEMFVRLIYYFGFIV